MDERLRRASGLRAERLTFPELPSLAVAIVASVRKQCHVQNFVMDGEPCVRLYGDGFNAVVRGSDWKRVLPFLLDGTFEPSVVPVPMRVTLDPNVQFDVPALLVEDAFLYQRVLGVLKGLFPVGFPTSKT